MKFNPHEVRLNTEKTRKTLETKRTGILTFYEFGCLVQSEVKKIILVKSNVREVRFNPHRVRFTNHISDSSLLDISFLPIMDGYLI